MRTFTLDELADIMADRENATTGNLGRLDRFCAALPELEREQVAELILSLDSMRDATRKLRINATSFQECMMFFLMGLELRAEMDARSAL